MMGVIQCLDGAMFGFCYLSVIRFCVRDRKLVRSVVGGHGYIEGFAGMFAQDVDGLVVRIGYMVGR